MKSSKVLTILNIINSAIAWLLFLVNQFCKMRIVDTGELWEATGFIFALLVGPASLLISLIFTVIVCIRVCRIESDSEIRRKYLITNIACPVITIIMLCSCYFGNALTWGWAWER